MPEQITIGSSSRLHGKGFQIQRGWSDELSQQLVAGSREPAIQRHTPKDMNERFIDADAAGAWFEEKQPIIYALSRAAQLAGVIWFSHRPRPEYSADYTFAIRMYDVARGVGLAEPFIDTSEDDFRSIVKPEGIWLETEFENSAARNLYHKIGYTVIAASPGRITMRR
ncbi:GNAT family N-acetyltransferase [Candidatus Saccharibacteria bacterium]|nr:GNAT family N-acetyltransferase [Candidatus Saccharibacteria bacterium]